MILCSGPSEDIGNQQEGFLFSLSNPSNKSPQFLPIQQGKPAGRTDPLLGPSFGQRDLELYADVNGRLEGFSGLGASFDVTNILSPSAARNFFTGSQHFYPDKVEVFYYNGKSTINNTVWYILQVKFEEEAFRFRCNGICAYVFSVTMLQLLQLQLYLSLHIKVKGSLPRK